jgi:TPR repeat protein
LRARFVGSALSFTRANPVVQGTAAFLALLFALATLAIIVELAVKHQQPVALQPSTPQKPTKESLESLRKRAEQGSSDAEFNLGRAYFIGDAVAQDDAEAMRWFRKAAEQGDSTSGARLGVPRTASAA